MLVLDLYNYQEFFVKYCVQYTGERLHKGTLVSWSAELFLKCGFFCQNIAKPIIKIPNEINYQIC